MTSLFVTYERITSALNAHAHWLIPTLARLIFIAVLFIYYWNSALTKIDGSIFSPSLGAYAQIFPRAMEAAGYDVSQMGAFRTLVVVLGTWAEFALPILIAIGLITRLAALGMIGFVAMQSLTDIYGHGADARTVGIWFDGASDALILDQRAFWVFTLITLVMMGAGPLSVDAVVRRGAEASR